MIIVLKYFKNNKNLLKIILKHKLLPFFSSPVRGHVPSSEREFRPRSIHVSSNLHICSTLQVPGHLTNDFPRLHRFTLIPRPCIPSHYTFRPRRRVPSTIHRELSRPTWYTSFSRSETGNLLTDQGRAHEQREERERQRDRELVLIVFTCCSLSLYLSSSLSSVWKEYLEYRFPISRRPAGNLYAKLASAATHVQGGAHRSPWERERGMEEEEREKRLYYHVVPAEICMRKRGNAITRRGSREKCRGTIFSPPPRLYPLVSVRFGQR